MTARRYRRNDRVRWQSPGCMFHSATVIATWMCGVSIRLANGTVVVADPANLRPETAVAS